MKSDDQKKIIIIDDDSNVRDALRYLFESVYLKVETHMNAPLCASDSETKIR